MSKAFVFESGPERKFHAPDGSVWSEGWWSDLTLPAARPEVSIANSLLMQVAQEGSAGKQSCVLTSQLNALIVTGQLNPEDARRLQDELATDPTYARHWPPRRLGICGMD